MKHFTEWTCPKEHSADKADKISVLPEYELFGRPTVRVGFTLIWQGHVRGQSSPHLPQPPPLNPNNPLPTPPPPYSVMLRPQWLNTSEAFRQHSGPRPFCVPKNTRSPPRSIVIGAKKKKDPSILLSFLSFLTLILPLFCLLSLICFLNCFILPY